LGICTWAWGCGKAVGKEMFILGHWGGDIRQKRFPIWTLQGLQGWMKRVLRQMQVGLVLWQN